MLAVKCPLAHAENASDHVAVHHPVDLKNKYTQAHRSLLPLSQKLQKGIAARSKKLLLAPGLTRNKKLLGTKAIATRSKDATSRLGAVNEHQTLIPFRIPCLQKRL